MFATFLPDGRTGRPGGRPRQREDVNPQKAKGDRYERAGLSYLIGLAPDLAAADAQRILGLGRLVDHGDLHIYPDVAVQVKGRDHLIGACRLAATGAARQAVNKGVPLGLGLARRVAKKTHPWIAVTTSWPTPFGPETTVTGLASTAIDRCVDDLSGIPTDRRVVVVSRNGAVDVVYAHPHAWIAAYRAYRRAAAHIGYMPPVPAPPAIPGCPVCGGATTPAGTHVDGACHRPLAVGL